MIIDFHTHIFPDQIAAKAVPLLAREGKVKAHLTGTGTDLIASMDRAGIEQSVVCSIATKPSQFQTILAWSRQIRSARIIPFPSIHPDSVTCLEEVTAIKQAGFAGIKMHPYYQNFSLDEERLAPLFERISQEGLLLIMHTGFDIAFPRLRRADPARILGVTKQFPALKLITTHLGAWEQWSEVKALLTGKPIYMDLSFALDSLDRTTARHLLLNHPPDFLLFGSDSPWADQPETIAKVKALGLGKKLEEQIFFKNAQRLLAGQER